MAVGILMVLLGAWVLVRLFRGGLAHQLVGAVGVG